MPGRKHPMFSMRAALQSGSESARITEAPVDLLIRDVHNNTYLALRAGVDSLLLTECEACALAAAIRKLSILATAPDNARGSIGNVALDGGRA